MEKGVRIMKGKVVILLKSIMDIFVANYYLNKPAGQAGKIGIIGVVTSLIAICQHLKVI